MSELVPGRVLALLDDALAAPGVLEMSSAVAHQLQRPLELVFVESAPALLAAALPFAQVLAHGGARWAPLLPQDVERGYRMQAARLRDLAGRIALQRSISWSLRVVRGALQQIALELQGQSDLMLVASSTGLSVSEAFTLQAPTRPVRRWRVAVISDGSESAQKALQLAQQLAATLGAVLDIRAATGRDPGTVTKIVAGIGTCDLLVLPRTLVGPGELGRLSQPALLVG